MDRDKVRFPTGNPEKLAAWLKQHGPELPLRVFSAVTDVTTDRGGVSVGFRPAPEPGEQWVAGRRTACHLYGVQPRSDGEHVGDPDLDALRALPSDIALIAVDLPLPLGPNTQVMHPRCADIVR